MLLRPTSAPRTTGRRRFSPVRILPLLLLLHLGAPFLSPASAQSEFPITISAGAHALTLPWYPGPVTAGFNPTGMMGTDRTIRSSEHWRVYYGVSVGFFRHNWWFSGVSIEPELGIGWRIGGGFQTDFRIGLGYMHYFWRRKSLELKEGRYVEATDWGRPSLILPLSLTLGYPGAYDDPLSVSPFVTARWGIQGLFLKEVPVMTHLQFLGGVRIEDDEDKPTGGGGQ